jgi:glycosyltransferase involved in cell wall biosynthesis
MKLSVIIPVYNEIHTLDTILAKVIQTLPEINKEIILVDDCSTDGTRQWLQDNFDQTNSYPVKIMLNSHHYLLESKDGEYQLQSSHSSVAIAKRVVSIKIIYCDRNFGKGAALRTGFKAATGDVFVIQDADLEYDPQDWGKMWRIIAEGWGDVVFGSRFYGEPHRVLYFHHLLGNKVISNLINLLCNTTLSDIEVCYKMFRREVLEEIDLTCNDFGFEVEFTVKVTKSPRRWRIYETGIAYYGRTYEEGKKIDWQDGIKALWYIVRFRFFDGRYKHPRRALLSRF